MSLVETTKHLFDTKEDADVTFIIDKQEFHAHQFVLINRSPVLKAMIKGPMAPADQRHEITDPEITYEDFENFIKFLYTDECEIDDSNVEALLHLGHMYDVTFLFQTCVNMLPELVGVSDVYKFGELGLLYENKCDMVIKCLNEAPRCSTESLKYYKGYEMVWISPELALEFVKHCPRTAEFTEDDVFQKIFDWTKGQCEVQKLKIDAVNIKTFMAPFEPYIKYEKISGKSLATTVYDYKLIPEERLLKCYREYILVKEEIDISVNEPVEIYQPPIIIQRDWGASYQPRGSRRRRNKNANYNAVSYW